ncbi:hypothetical protein GHT06_010656 [Daphnia sinensis]|uniref:Uncharacterized protein n=1 Tax=Daphnia sinensis TaxID=1820382 RepID=A0AAD5L1E1_9CRUS|nr:hypothetical protein GHT06_010656 [Daphnia sinensis]
MRNQFEKMLMQHNPLFWAQLQRNIATSTVDFNVDCPLSGFSGMKHMKEKAVNTSHNSSTSEQHSLHEEGIWPHTPSPVLDIHMQQMACDDTKNINIFSSTPHRKDKSENQSTAKDRRVTNSNLMPNQMKTMHISSPQGSEEKVSSSTLEIHHPPHNLRTQQQENQFVPSNVAFSSATIDEETSRASLKTTTVANLGAMKKESSENIAEHYLGKQKEETEIHSLSASEIKPPSVETAVIPVVDPVVSEPQDTNIVYDDIKELQSIPNNTSVVDEVAQQIPASLSPNKIKPFRLDSDSDCADDPISGPLSGKNVGDDDSDSFWN